VSCETVPVLLTVEEAGVLLRIGRTKAYAMAREWRETDGRSGLPVIDLGHVLRVPRRALEVLNSPTSTAPAGSKRPGKPHRRPNHRNHARAIRPKNDPLSAHRRRGQLENTGTLPQISSTSSTRSPAPPEDGDPMCTHPQRFEDRRVHTCGDRAEVGL